MLHKKVDIIKLEPLRTFTALSKLLFFELVEFQLRHLLWGVKPTGTYSKAWVFYFDSEENYYSILIHDSISFWFKGQVIFLWSFCGAHSEPGN